MKKRILSLVLCFAMVAAILPQTVLFASAAGATFSVEDVTVAPGQSATITVSADLIDMYSMEYVISYDSALSIAAKPTKLGFEDLDMTPGSNIEKNPYKVIFDHRVQNTQTESGDVFAITFNTPEQPGVYPVSIECTSFNNYDEVYTTITANIIVEGDPIPTPEPDPTPEYDPMRDTYFTVEDVTVAPGQAATMTVFANLVYVYSMEYNIKYDSALSIAEKPTKLGFEDFNMVSGAKLTLNPYKVIFDIMDPATESGDAFAITFNTPEQPGVYPVEFDCMAVNDYNIEEMTVTANIIVEGDPIPTPEPDPTPEPEPTPDPKPEYDPLRDIYFTVEDIIVAPGGVGEMVVFANLIDMYSMEYAITYDSALSIAAKPTKLGFEDFDMTPGNKLTSNPYRVIFDLMDPVTVSGDVFSIPFNAPMEEGEYPVEFECTAFNDDDEAYMVITANVIVRDIEPKVELTARGITTGVGDRVTIPVNAAIENVESMSLTLSSDNGINEASSLLAGDELGFTMADGSSSANSVSAVYNSADKLSVSGKLADISLKMPEESGTYSYTLAYTAENEYKTVEGSISFDIIVKGIDDANSIYVPDVTVIPGGVAKVSTYANIADVFGMEYSIYYDSAVSVAEAPMQTGFESFDMTPSGKLENMPYRVIFDAMSPETMSGKIFDISFNAPSEPGVYPVSIEWIAYNDTDEESMVTTFDIIVKPVVTAGVLTVGNAEAMPEETVEIPLTISENPGVGRMEANIDLSKWPADVAVAEVILGEAFAGMDFETASTENGINIKWTSDADCTANGVIATLVLTLGENAPEGNFDLPVDITVIENEASFVNLAMVNGGYIEITHYPIGDVNGDTKTNVRDVVALRRYIAGGYDITVIEKRLDVNGDSRVNVRDVVALRNMIANS